MEGSPLPAVLAGINLLVTESIHAGIQPHPPSVVIPSGGKIREIGRAVAAVNDRGSRGFHGRLRTKEFLIQAGQDSCMTCVIVFMTAPAGAPPDYPCILQPGNEGVEGVEFHRSPVRNAAAVVRGVICLRADLVEGEDAPAAAVGDRAIDRSLHVGEPVAAPAAGAIATNPMTAARAAKDAAALRACLRSVRASFRALPLNLRTMAPLQSSQAAYRAGHPRLQLPRPPPAALRSHPATLALHW